MDKKVSIIIPVYNVEKYIKRCIDSIINQTYKNFELILINDCSEDKSVDICYSSAKEDNRIKVISLQHNSGQSTARNVGIEEATGEYVMFVDSDDYVCDNYIEEMVKAIEEKDVDIVRCKAMLYKENGEYSIENYNGHENKLYRDEDVKYFAKSSLAVYSKTYVRCFIWAIIIKKEKLKTKFDPNMKSREDLVFYIELLLDAPIPSIYFLDKPLYHYCYNVISVTKGRRGCSKYIDGVMDSSEAIKRIFLKNDMLDQKLDNDIDNANINVIIHRLYYYSNESIIKIRSVVKEQFQKDKAKKMIKKVNISSVSIRWKVVITCLKLHLYFFAALYIKKAKK